MSDIISTVKQLKNRLRDLEGKKVLIVGDIGLDEYVLGQAKRISPEAPVPVVEVDHEESRLGLAGNVAQNVSSLGGVPVMIAVAGRDAAADQLSQLLKSANVSSDDLIVDESRPTTRKLRVMVQHHHIVRVDYEHRKFLAAKLEQEILKRVRDNIASCCAVIVQDYAKGVISEALVQEMVKIARANGKRILVDPHRTTPIRTYRGVDLMTPNFDEATALSGIAYDDLRPDSEHLERVGRALIEATQAPQMVITRGKEGMRLIEKERVVDLPTYAQQVSDVAGAGDTVIATLALGWGSGLTLEQACVLANFAAGVVVGKVGCVPCETAELLSYMEQHASSVPSN